jgi:hypothetical protein
VRAKNAALSSVKISLQAVVKQTVHRLLKWIKPDKYAALAPSESDISHFETVAAYNSWSAYDKVAYLKASLSGDAAQLLWNGGDHTTISYDGLVSKLKARIGSQTIRNVMLASLEEKPRIREIVDGRPTT